MRPFRRVLWTGLVALLLFPCVSRLAGAAAERATILLKNGATIRGEILRKGADRVIVDLGFTVLEVPSDRIDRITTSPGKEKIRETGDLYRVEEGREELTVEENVDRCAEAVVEVRTPTGLGSGFIIDPAGYVITNDHVIAGERKITITLFESSERELRRVPFEKARVVATHPQADLALLKIEDPGGRTLPWVPLGDSERLRQGETLFAIGSPLGFDRTVSQGIVSLRNRPLRGRLYIQSTTQINPGNSGGPLFNLKGEVVGINNMKIAAMGVEGMSFAVPSSVLREFLRNRDAFAFDARHPNSGFRYNEPPRPPANPPESRGEGRSE